MLVFDEKEKIIIVTIHLVHKWFMLSCKKHLKTTGCIFSWNIFCYIFFFEFWQLLIISQRLTWVQPNCSLALRKVAEGHMMLEYVQVKIAWLRRKGIFLNLSKIVDSKNIIIALSRLVDFPLLQVLLALDHKCSCWCKTFRIKKK